MKKIFFWLLIPSVVLGIVYQSAYNAGRSEGIRNSAVPAPVTAVSSPVPPPSIAPKKVETKVIEPPMVTEFSTGSGPPVLVRRSARTVSSMTDKLASDTNKTVVLSRPEVSGERAIQIPNKDSGKGSVVPVPVYETKLEPLKIKPTPDVPVIAKPAAAPKVSGERTVLISNKDSGKRSAVPVSVYETKSEPLKIKPTPDVPVIAKPAAAPKEDDCGCNKKK